jgi:Domain of unknown function (DUF4188)
MKPPIKTGRWTADIEGDFVVFLIAAKPNSFRFLRFLKDLGGARGMQKMLDHLVAHPEKGLLGYDMYGVGGLVVQYWRSFEQLEAFARNTDDPHTAVWRNYVRRTRSSSRTGIWHETYLVRAGEYEAVYANMRPTGLAKASGVKSIAGESRARERLGRVTVSADSSGDDDPR